MSNAVIMPLVYAGLAGTLLSLIVATIQQKWSCRVFFLLALRLAIGWHFLFEGLHKIHSYSIGPSETNKPFNSAPYFKAATGPLGPFMRKQFDDTDAYIAERLKGPRELTPDELRKMPDIRQGAMCPLIPAKAIDDLVDDAVKAIQADAEAAREAATEAEAKAMATAKTDAEKAKIKETADKARAAAKQDFDDAPSKTVLYRKEAAKRKFALWAYGVEGRDCKVKGITNDVPLTAPQRLEHIENLRRRVKEEEDRLSTGLGNGFGIDQKKAAELRLELIAAQTDLAKDIDAFIEELKKDLFGKSKVPPAPAPEPSTGQTMDKITMWFLVVVGACLMGGLFTRLACIAGCGFLVLTYLTHPPFPWFPLPPNTEGNPVFINKNVIEGLALLALATFPTGRWLGLDALIARICGCGRHAEPGERGV